MQQASRVFTGRANTVLATIRINLQSLLAGETRSTFLDSGVALLIKRVTGESMRVSHQIESVAAFFQSLRMRPPGDSTLSDVIILVDNSNIFIEGQKCSARLKRVA